MFVYGFCLPDKYRGEFKPPRGVVLSSDPQSNIHYLEEIMNSYRGIIAVGDYVTYNMLSTGIKPAIAVIDYKTLRTENISFNFKKYYSKQVKIINPPAMISASSLKKIQGLSEDTLVEVIGEEDLLLLPFILLPRYDGYLIVYGQPSRGMVIVENNILARKTAINFWILLKPCINKRVGEKREHTGDRP